MQQVINAVDLKNQLPLVHLLIKHIRLYDKTLTVHFKIIKMFSDKVFKDFSYFTESWWPYIFTILISIVTGIRIYIGGRECPSKNLIKKKIVLITGASSGLGLETAKELASRGAKIILICRDIAKGRFSLDEIKRETPNAEIDVRELDVALLSHVREFVMKLENDYAKIDVLINNAGIIFYPPEKTSEGFDRTLVTNYLGHFLLTHLMLPLLDKSENGRIINLTALAHFTAKLHLDDLNLEKEYNDRDAFAQSKLCLMMFTKYLPKLLKSSKITVNAANPGIVRDTNHLRYSSLTKSLMTRISIWPWMWLFLKTPRQGIQTIIYLAVNPALNTTTGAYFSDCEKKEPADCVNDEESTRQLYQLSCNLCKIETDKIFSRLANSCAELTDETGDNKLENSNKENELENGNEENIH